MRRPCKVDLSLFSRCWLKAFRQTFDPSMAHHGACPAHLAAEEGHANVLEGLPLQPSEEGHANVVEVLAAAGADLDKTAAPGCAWTPLYFAAAQARAEAGRLEAAQFLIARGVRVMLSDESGLSPLDIAERFRVRQKEMSAVQDARKLPEPNLQREAPTADWP
ncbi:hypothetical protein T484DRAFT_1807544 [Baffinella frigidus]|nr:hypothetical protein T484DRAFT_1807544 [Cryptophyta sp. CCMP2293]